VPGRPKPYGCPPSKILFMLGAATPPPSPAVSSAGSWGLILAPDCAMKAVPGRHGLLHHPRHGDPRRPKAPFFQCADLDQACAFRSAHAHYGSNASSAERKGG
jgi:hypothetical protein